MDSQIVNSLTVDKFESHDEQERLLHEAVERQTVSRRARLVSSEEPTIDSDRRYHIPFESDLDRDSQQSSTTALRSEGMDLLMRAVASITMATERQERAQQTEYARREQQLREKTSINNVKDWERGMNIASYIQKFEGCMRSGKVSKDRWCSIISSHLKGQLWQDWIAHEMDGDRNGYDNAKDMVLEMHGVSLLQCIKSIFHLRAEGETFGARATAVRAYMDRLQGEAKTIEEFRERMEMWITLSSYSDECIAAAIKDTPKSLKELAQIVCRFEEVHPQVGKASGYQGQRHNFHHSHSDGHDRHFTRSYQQHQQQQQQLQPLRQGAQSHSMQQQQYQSSRQVAQSQQPLQQQQPPMRPMRHDRYGYRTECYICHEVGHKVNGCPNKGKGFSNQLYAVKPIRCLGNGGAGAKKVPNIVQGMVNGVLATFLLDTGADITVVNKRLISGEQLTGEVVSLEGIGGAEFVYPTAVIEIVAGDIDIPIVAAVADLGDSADGGLLGNDIEKETFLTLLRQASYTKLHADNVVHVKMTRAAKQREHVLEENVIKEELEDQATPKSVQNIEQVEWSVTDEESDSTGLVEDSVGLSERLAASEVVDLKNDGGDEEMELRGVVLSLDDACKVGDEHVDSVELSLADLDVPDEPRTSSIRAEFGRQTGLDDSLKDWRELAKERRRGFAWDGPLLRKETEGPDSTTRSLIVVPRKFRELVMRTAHDQFGHMGERRTRYVIGRQFVWPGLAKDVSRWCKSCMICQKQGKSRPMRAPMCEVPVLTEPMEAVAIDIVGPFPRAKSGYRYLLTFICLASRYPEALPLKTITAEEVAEGLVELFSRHGIPRSVLSDQGKQFKSKLFKLLCEKLCIQKLQSSPYHPQSNGVVERFHGTLVPMLRKAIVKEVDWPSQIKYCLFAMRCALNRSTGFSPFEVLLGRNVRSPLDLIVDEIDGNNSETVPVCEWIEKLNDHLSVIRDYVRENGIVARDERKAVHDKGTSVRSFPVGTMVLLRTPGLSGKLEESWEGPFEVDSVPNKVNVKLKIPGRQGKSRVVHVNNIKAVQPEKFAVHRLVVTAEEHSMDIEVLRLGESQLTDQQKADIESIKVEYSHVLTNKPGKIVLAEHAIDTGEARPIRSQPYMISPTKLEGVKKEINELLALGIITPSTSPWSCPVVPIVKPDKSIWLCVEYRKVNGVTVPDPYYIPTVDELIGKVGKAKFLTKLDLSKGFYQVPIKPSDQDKTAFITPWGKFSFVRMPFGLRNAPSTFQRMMDTVLSGVEMYAVPYIDDILVYSESWDEHLQHVRGVLSRLSDAGLTAKPSKCEWGKKNVVYLGFKVGDGNVEVPEARVKAIKEYVKPKTKAQMKSFLGLTSYYRKFVRAYSDIAKPLHAATHNNCPSQVEWTRERLEAFSELKNVLSSAHFLTIPIQSDSLVLQTDASSSGIGGCLSVIRDGQERPVAFYSRKLNAAESRYAATELEYLAVVECVRQFECHLDGNKFVLQTDHKALESLHKSKLANKRLARWAMRLQGFDFVIQYRPGKANGNADGLSRQAWPEEETDDIVIAGTASN